MTGQSISHTATWNVVQELGERVDEQEKYQAKEATSFQGKGQIESKVLFEEQDGRKRNVLFGLLKEERTDDLLECIEAYINCSEDER